MCDDAVSGWESATAEDGTTPMAFATAHGNAEIIRHLIAAKTLKKALAAQGAAGRAHPAAPLSLGSVLAADEAAAAARGARAPAGAGASGISRAAAAEATASALAAAAAAAKAAAPPAPKAEAPVAEPAAAKPAPPAPNADEPAEMETAGSSSSSVCLKPVKAAEDSTEVHDSSRSIAFGYAARGCSKAGKCKAGAEVVPSEAEEEDAIARQKAEGKVSRWAGAVPGRAGRALRKCSALRCAGCSRSRPQQGPSRARTHVLTPPPSPRPPAPRLQRRRAAMHATSAALTFRDPALEAKYAKWYHSGQVRLCHVCGRVLGQQRSGSGG